MNELTLKEHLPLPQIAMSLTGVSDKTRETYTIQMNSYQNYCRENDLKLDLDSLKSWIMSANKPSTQALRTAASRKVFGVLYKNHPRLEELKSIIAEIKVVKREHSVSESKYLTNDELLKVISAAPQRIKLMIRTLYMTGIRISELLSMRHDQCVPIRDGAVYEITIIGKRSKQNKVFINKELFEDIKGCFSGTVYLFEHMGDQYNRKYVTAEIKRAGLTIGKNISAHTIRHSRAYDLMSRGITIDKVSKFLMHQSVSTTANFYLHEKPSLEELNII